LPDIIRIIMEDRSREHTGVRTTWRHGGRWWTGTRRVVASKVWVKGSTRSTP